jgi:protein tyrosine/serine phosphatase
MKKTILLILGIFLFSTLCLGTEARLRPDNWATPVISETLDNWHRVDGLVYRSEQPDDRGMQELEKFGIQRILNLREFHDDEDEVKGTSLKPVDLPINAARIKDEDVIRALQIIKASDQPILVHCWHGADRTGTIVAMYRIVEQGWSREAALDELENGGFGYHSIYQNIPRYIEQADIERIRAAVNAP